MTAAFVASGNFNEQRASNLLDGGAPYYDIYETSDGKHMSVGALEPQFYEIFADLLGIRDQAPDRFDPAKYDQLLHVIEKAFVYRTQAARLKLFAGTAA